MKTQQTSGCLAAACLAGVLSGRAAFLGALGALLIATSSAAAEPDQSQFPDGCSASDRALMVTAFEAQMEALASGDLDGYAQLSRGMEASLSRACRSGLDKLAPARTRCSAHERELLLSGVQAIMEAAAQGDLEKTVELLGTLGESVSQSCWLAVNRPQHPALQRACTSPELDAIAGLAGPSIRASADLWTTGDIGAYLESIQELENQLTAALSPKCEGALVQLQQQNQSPSLPPPGKPSPGNPSERPSFVQDHGGGTYSVSGVGACTPSGCMAF